MTRTPSRVSRRPAIRSSRMRTSAESEGERRTSKRSCTAVESLLTFWPPGPEARTKRSSSSCSSMLMRSVIRIMTRSRSWRGQVALRQHLAFLDRRLVERIDAEQARRDDGLQHEVHEHFAEAFLVEPIEMEGAHRASVPGQ